MDDRNSWDPPPFFVEEFAEVKKTASAAQGAIHDLRNRVDSIETSIRRIPESFKRLESDVSDLRTGQRQLMEAVLKNNDHDLRTSSDVGNLKEKVASHTAEEFARRSTGLHAFSGLVATVVTVLVSAAWLILQIVASWSGLSLTPTP